MITMPRKKTIDSENIRLSGISEDVIERKNCLQANLVFKEPLSPICWHLSKEYLKCSVDKRSQTISVSLKNSWKGLVVFLLSLCYFCFEYKTLSRVADANQLCITNLSFKYDGLAKIEGSEYMFKKTDDEIEQVPAPPSWAPLYVRGDYKVKDIERSISNFCQLLKIEKAKSTVKTEYDNLPCHQYKKNPSGIISTSGRLCGRSKNLVKGTAIISYEDMDMLYGSLYAVGFSADVPIESLPELQSTYDDPGMPIPYYGYQITEKGLPFLRSYFPFYSKELSACAKYDGKKPFIIFDRRHLGKWG